MAHAGTSPGCVEPLRTPVQPSQNGNAFYFARRRAVKLFSQPGLDHSLPGLLHLTTCCFITPTCPNLPPHLPNTTSLYPFCNPTIYHSSSSVLFIDATAPTLRID